MDKTHAKELNRLKQRQNKKRMLYYVILFICVAVIVILLDVVFIVSPDKALSESENRTLQQMPKLNFSTLTNGRFESSFEDYVADQFPGRDSWVGL